MKKTLCYIVMAWSMLSSCQREEDVDIEVPYKRKLVAAVFVAAGDSLIRASLTYTTPVFGSKPAIDPERAVLAGGVLLCNGVQSDFRYDSTSQEHTAYTVQHAASAGDVYQVVFSDAKESVTGSTVVPGPVDLDIRLTFDSTVGSESPNAIYHAEITYLLKGAAPAYVKLLPILVMDDSMSIVPMNSEVFKPMVLLYPGQTVSSRFFASASFSGLYPSGVRCLIISCDEAFASYTNATQGVDFGSIFPGSEPGMIYSNMSNHIGIIASYNMCGEQYFGLK